MMVHVIYKIVKHGEGWAYCVGATFSETFASENEARSAASAAAREHELIGNTIGIAFEDSNGHWHEELSRGSDRPVATVEK
jgi:hypothetical protein